MYLYISQRRYKDQLHRYAQICISERVNGKPVRRVLGSLGRLDHLSPATIDGLIASLRRLASPGIGLGLAEMEMLAARRYGPIQVARQLWEELGLPELIAAGAQSFPVEEALFRLVANRLVDPRSKLATVDWQETVAWPRPGALAYTQLLRAMDVLQAQKKPVEAGLFGRVRELFSVPLHIVWYDLTSSYFEGDGVCELAAYGYSRDHRPDRTQVVLGLALTQEGFPVAHDLFAGNTADVRTVKQMATQLRDRFGFAEAVVVGDRGLLSAENAAALQELGLRYVLALRTHQHARVPRVVAAAVARGLARPRAVDAPWSIQEVAPIDGVRHVVVYSAFRAAHDRVVRTHRLKTTRDALARLRQQVADGQLATPRAVTARATRILSQSKVSRFFRWELVDGRFAFRLNRTVYRTQRQLDGIYVLVSNASDLATTEIVAAYRQLIAVEDAFRVLKSLVKLRPIYHWAKRRVEAHVFICVLAYLLATVLEHKLARAGLPLTAARALDALASVQAVEHRWGQSTVTQMTRPSSDAAAILRALGLSELPRILRFEPAPPPPDPSHPPSNPL
jgi:hypothetical protein